MTSRSLLRISASALALVVAACSGKNDASPFVGTFYAAATPGADPFIKVGSEIRPGQTLCIVEAMKLMNEIEAEQSGTVLEVLRENGKPVEYGDKLFKVRKG